MTKKETAHSIAETIVGRRTIHEFRTDAVPDESIIIKAIDAARWAPNHHLTEPWQFYMPGQETIKKIIELNTEIVAAKIGTEAAAKKKQRWLRTPGWLVVSCDRSADELKMKEDYAACCCLMQNFMLYLWEQDIGVKWSTGDVIRDERFYDLLWIDPDAEEVIGIFWYGYPQEVPVTVRKPVEQCLIKLP